MDLCYDDYRELGNQGSTVLGGESMRAQVRKWGASGSPSEVLRKLAKGHHHRVSLALAWGPSRSDTSPPPPAGPHKLFHSHSLPKAGAGRPGKGREELVHLSMPSRPEPLTTCLPQLPVTGKGGAV